jgi:hypothetical protein
MADFVVLELADDWALSWLGVPVLLARPRALASTSRPTVAFPATSLSANAAKPDEDFRSRVTLERLVELILDARLALIESGG